MKLYLWLLFATLIACNAQIWAAKNEILPLLIKDEPSELGENASAKAYHDISHIELRKKGPNTLKVKIFLAGNLPRKITEESYKIDISVDFDNDKETGMKIHDKHGIDFLISLSRDSQNSDFAHKLNTRTNQFKRSQFSLEKCDSRKNWISFELKSKLFKEYDTHKMIFTLKNGVELADRLPVFIIKDVDGQLVIPKIP